MLPAPTKPTEAPASSSARVAMPDGVVRDGLWCVCFGRIARVGADDPKVLRSRGER